MSYTSFFSSTTFITYSSFHPSSSNVTNISTLPYKTCWKFTISIPRIIHVQDRNMNYYMKNNNMQYEDKYKNTYSSKQKEKKNNDNDAYSQRLQSVTRPRSWLRFASPCCQSTYRFPNRFAYTQRKWQDVFLFRITLATIFSSRYNLCNLLFLKTYFVYLSILKMSLTVSIISFH